MTLARIQIEHVKDRITRKIDEMNDKADASPDDLQAAIDMALADGLALALSYIEEEEAP